MSRCGTFKDYLSLVTALKAKTQKQQKNFFFRGLVERNNKDGWKHSYQPVFLWALKLYAFCNKNIKKHGGEFMLEYRKVRGCFKSIPFRMCRA